MKDDVRATTLGELVRETRGSIRTGPFGTTLRASEYSTSGVPVVSVGEVGYGAFRVHSETRRVGEDVLNRLPEYKLEVGDIVFGRKGSVDRSATVRPAQSGWFLGSDGIRVRLGAGIDQLFVGYALQRREARQWLVANSTGTTMATLNQQVLDGVPLVLPSPSEQHAVVNALDDISSLISSIERLIAKKRDIKQGLMQELLTGRTRLPGFSGAWRARAIGEFAQVKAGGTPSTAVRRYWGGQVRWMSSGEIHRKRITEVDGRITDDGLRESAAQLLPVGTVLMALAGQGKTRGTVALSEVELATNQSIAGILPSGTHDPEFLYYNLDTRYDEVRGESAGDGGRGGLNLTIINKLRVLMPGIDEQRAVSGVLRDVDAEIAALGRRLGSARNVKYGMMQELLSGRTRLVSEVAA